MPERSWSTVVAASWPAVVAMLCVGAQLGFSTSAFDVGRPILITLLSALGIAAVSTSLWWSMGLRHEALGVRLVLAIPLVLSVALIVALMLDGHVRRAEVLG